MQQKYKKVGKKNRINQSNRTQSLYRLEEGEKLVDYQTKKNSFSSQENLNVLIARKALA